MDQLALEDLLGQLVTLTDETEWVEFKENNGNPVEIGEYCSALSNSALLSDQEAAYLVFGVKNNTHELVGTSVTLEGLRQGQEEYQNWLANRLKPSVNIDFFPFNIGSANFLLLRIQAAFASPVHFMNDAFIRVGSAKRPLNEFPEKQRLLWQKCSRQPFETAIAIQSVESDLVFELLDIGAYYQLLKLPSGEDRATTLDRLHKEGIIQSKFDGKYSITNLGAILLANDLGKTGSLSRRRVRVITYDGKSRINALREREGQFGYANGFENLIRYIHSQIPEQEVIKSTFREQVSEYPVVSIREFVANALIHQDFLISGTGPMVEIFTDRVEISNPGAPLVELLRLMDNPPISRNEALAAFMRRVGICEERGSGIDRAIYHIEIAQLPSPEFQATKTHMKVIIRGPRSFAETTRDERLHACYWHCVLTYLTGEQMTNKSLRKRLGIADGNYPMVSQIINEAKSNGLIKDFDPENRAPRYARYIPFWV